MLVYRCRPGDSFVYETSGRKWRDFLRGRNLCEGMSEKVLCRNGFLGIQVPDLFRGKLPGGDPSVSAGNLPLETVSVDAGKRSVPRVPSGLHNRLNGNGIICAAPVEICLKM